MEGRVYIALEGHARWAREPGQVCERNELKRYYEKDTIATPIGNLFWPYHQVDDPLINTYDVNRMYINYKWLNK